MSKMNSAPVVWETAPKIHLYEDIAARIAGMISSGAYRPGDRLPSIRELSRQMRVSINTVMAAYVQLESRQLIEARRQSGYFVRSGAAEPARLHAVDARAEGVEAKPIEFESRALRTIRALSDPKLIPLAASAPNSALLPIDRLNRMLAAQVRRHRIESVSYAPAPGIMRLREQIAKRLVATGCTLAPEDIVITSGCVEGVTLALQAVCRPGQTVAVASPVYWTFLNSIQHLGLQVAEIPACPHDGISLDVLDYALRQKAIHACIVISNFNNPLGSVIPDAKKLQLAELFAKHETPLIEDDVYGDLAFSRMRPPSIKAFDAAGWVIHCSSFSKTLAPGYRVGWMVPGRFRREIETRKRLFNLATASPTQLAIAEFLANGGYDRHLRNLRSIYARQMAQLREAVGCAFPPGTSVTRPDGGTVLWVQMPEAVDAYTLYELAHERGVGVAPGPLFTNSRDYRNCIRLSGAFWSSEIEAAVRLVGRFATDLAER
jgi:DNA-binding transcriptional MocR family regulator